MLNSSSRSLILVLLLALTVRLLAASWWQARLPSPVAFAFDDSESYWVLAQAIAAGEPYRFGDDMVFRMPGYPLVLAPLFVVAGTDCPVGPARWLGALFGVGAVAGVIALTSRLTSNARASIAAGAIAAFYPGAIGSSILVLSEAPFMPLMIWQIVLSAAWLTSTSPVVRRRLTLGIGLVGGAATLVRPSWILFTPCLAIFLAVVALPPVRYRERLSAVAQVFIVMVLVLLPWWIRNGVVVGRWVPTTLQVGASLYDGWNPNATGASDMRFVRSFRDAQRAADHSAQIESTGPAFEVRLDHRMRRAAMNWAREHPTDVVRLAFVKAGRMWSPWPHASEVGRGLMRGLMIVSYLCLVAGALRGVGHVWGDRRRGTSRIILLCLAPALYLTVLHMIFIGSVRYRQPALLPIMAIAAMSLGDRSVRKLGAESKGL